MVYANKTSYEQVRFVYKLKNKVGKRIAKTFPLNTIRVWGLKLCGFKVGSKVYIGEDLIVASIISEASCNLKIGDRVAIGPRVTLILSSDGNWSNLMQRIDFIKGTIVIGNDCWIGAGAIILPNVIIGESSIIGAGAVVTKDVEPFTVVAGVPAIMVKKINQQT